MIHIEHSGGEITRFGNEATLLIEPGAFRGKCAVELEDGDVQWFDDVLMCRDEKSVDFQGIYDQYGIARGRVGAWPR